MQPLKSYKNTKKDSPKMPEPHDIFVSQDQSISSLIERIAQTPSDDVIVHLPPLQDGSVFHNKVNLKILQTEVQKKAKYVAFISADSAVLQSMKSLGLNVFRASSSSKSPHGLQPQPTPESDPFQHFFNYAEPSPPSSSNPPNPRPNQPRSQSKKGSLKDLLSKIPLLWTSLGSIAILFLLVILFMPRANITISAEKHVLNKDFEITVNSQASEVQNEALVVPGTLITEEGTKKVDFKPTGKAEAPPTTSVAENTKFTISVYNEFSQDPQALVDKTRFLTKDGVQLRTVKTVSVPGFTKKGTTVTPGTIDVEVISDKPIAAAKNTGRLSIPGFESSPAKYDTIYGILFAPKTDPTTATTPSSATITQTDIDQAKKKVTEELSSELASKLASDKADQVVSKKPAIVITDSTVSQKVGDSATEFSVSVKGKATWLASDRNLITSLIKTSLSSQVLKDQRLADDIKLTYADPVVSPDQTSAKIRVYTEYSIFDALNTEKFKKDLVAKTKSNAAEYFEAIEGIKEVKIDLKPGFWPLLPFLKNYITISVSS